MNEGKPGPSGEEPTARPEGSDGDFELARPDRAGAVPVDGHEGDHPLDRPRVPERPAEPTGASTRPEPPTTPSAPAPAASGGIGPEADPRDAPAPPSVPGAVAAGADSSDVLAPAPGAITETAASVLGNVGSAGSAAAPGAPVGGGERPKPLHDPDPYSTPPYGEPGPWAPAPPVQHPAVTPAHGMATAPPPPAAPTASPGAHPGPSAPVPPAPVTAPVPPAPAAAPEAAPVPPAPVAAAAPADAPPADPWGRYDPWAVAAAAPLQQAGPTVIDAKQRRGRARRTVVGAALVLALVSGGIGGIVGTYLERNGGVGTVELPQAGQEAAGRDPDSVAGIAAQALPSVVTLHVSGAGEAGTGTGFVLDARGHILTNNHVVEPAGDDGEITVTFNSGDTAEATVVGRDSGYDLAVVRVKGVSGLAPLPLGNSDNVRVGDPVVAIGAPFDLAGTVTSGIISARERPITAGGEKGDGSDVSYVDALQTDAPINPGNSGGPLLDAEARVIGINSAIRSAGSGADLDGGQAGSIGLGFAIPINQGKRVAEELINTGEATHPVIGITLDMDYSGDGARVAAKGSDGGPAVTTGGPGARAGIESGDVITEVDGRRVHSGEELIVKTRAHRPGDRLELTVERDGKERTVSLVLGSSGRG
ncbi:trypsin-like peptidase domain-containing protein [Streptomyces sp. NPDC014986]|uniref:trypsin-like peptidase domain-containing protein n=1 Tax=Streptomyces sp. NPDC014986 TaxID=3364934 RepID=UPI0036F8052F